MSLCGHKQNSNSLKHYSICSGQLSIMQIYQRCLEHYFKVIIKAAPSIMSFNLISVANLLLISLKKNVFDCHKEFQINHMGRRISGEFPVSCIPPTDQTDWDITVSVPLVRVCQKTSDFSLFQRSQLVMELGRCHDTEN